MNEPAHSICAKNYYYCCFSNFMYDIFQCKTHFYNNVNEKHCSDIDLHINVIYSLFYVI